MKLYDIKYYDRTPIGCIDLVDSSSASNYATAVRIAKRESLTHTRVEITLLQLTLKDCNNDRQLLESEWNNNKLEYQQWHEAFAGGKQVPAARFGNMDIWRASDEMFNYRDLKPRRK